MNAAASVLGSASAIFLAIYLGLRETLLAGGFLLRAGGLTALTDELASAPRSVGKPR